MMVRSKSESILTEKPLLSKSESPLRWLILIFNCIIMVGVYYTFDMPAALKSQMDSYMGSPDNFETYFSLLYTIPAFPNIILPFFGGYFVDTLGAYKCMTAFITIIAIGHVIFAFGLSIKSWPIMFLGRAIFGMGESSNSVANSTILADWFGGGELALAFGINLAVSRLGSVANNLISPVLASSGGVVFSVWFGAILMACSVGCAIFMLPINKATETIIEKNEMELEDANTPLHVLKDATEPPPPEEFRFRDALKFPLSYRILTLMCLLIYGVISPFNNIASTLLLERNYFRLPPDDCTLTVPNQCQSKSNPPLHCPSSTDYQPPLPINLTYDGKYYSKLTSDDIDCSDDVWKDGCTEEYCNRYDDSILEANTVMSIPYFMAACLLPFFGGFVDKYGQRALVLALVPVVLLIVHLTLAFSHFNPIPLLIGQGIAYTAMASTLWPSFSLVVEQRYTGLGFGIAFSMQNLGLSVIPLVIAFIYDGSNEKYIPNVELFFVAISAVGLVTGIWLNVDDLRHGSILNRPLASAPGEGDDALGAYDPLLREVSKDLDGDGDAQEGRGSRLSSREQRASRNSSENLRFLRK